MNFLGGMLDRFTARASQLELYCPPMIVYISRAHVCLTSSIPNIGTVSALDMILSSVSTATLERA